jgi:hypothetical protein
VAEFEEAGITPELVPLLNLSSAPVLGEGSLLSEPLTAFLSWNPKAYLLGLIARGVYILSSTPSCARGRLQEGPPVRLKVTTAERAQDVISVAIV